MFIGIFNNCIIVLLHVVNLQDVEWYYGRECRIVLQLLKAIESRLVLFVQIFDMRIEIQAHRSVEAIPVLDFVERLCSLIEILADKQAVTFLEEIFGLVFNIEVGILHTLVPRKSVLVLLVAIIDICHCKRSIVGVVAFGMVDGKIVELILSIAIKQVHRAHCKIKCCIVAIL